MGRCLPSAPHPPVGVEGTLHPLGEQQTRSPSGRGGDSPLSCVDPFFFLSRSLAVFSSSFALPATQHRMATPAPADFPLPFQWDDGVYVSPFVTSSDVAGGELVAFLASAASASVARRGSASDNQPTGEAAAVAVAERSELEFLDLGCGDGRVVHAMAAASAANGEAKPALAFTTCVGLDLDPDLVAAANAIWLSVPRPPSSPKVLFVQGDFLSEELNPRIASAHVVFCYLLPEALTALRPLFLELTGHWRPAAVTSAEEAAGGQLRLPRGGRQLQYLITNTWPIPYLASFEVARSEKLVVYGDRGSP